MPIFKLVLAALVSLIPFNGLRVLSYRLLFGYHIIESQIGFGSVIVLDQVSMEKARLGLFNLRDVVVGEHCYLGSAVRFAPGSCTGNHVLVAMGSVVASPLPVDNALVGGVPARVLKENYDWKSNDE